MGGARQLQLGRPVCRRSIRNHAPLAVIIAAIWSSSNGLCQNDLPELDAATIWELARAPFARKSGDRWKAPMARAE
jgi:hypothetical protein